MVEDAHIDLTLAIKFDLNNDEVKKELERTYVIQLVKLNPNQLRKELITLMGLYLTQLVDCYLIH